jgi:hypothetical protein
VRVREVENLRDRKKNFQTKKEDLLFHLMICE